MAQTLRARALVGTVRAPACKTETGVQRNREGLAYEIGLFQKTHIQFPTRTWHLTIVCDSNYRGFNVYAGETPMHIKLIN